MRVTVDTVLYRDWTDLLQVPFSYEGKGRSYGSTAEHLLTVQKVSDSVAGRSNSRQCERPVLEALESHG